MNRKNLCIAWAGVALIAPIVVTLALSGQENAPSRGRIGMPHDWSHRHVIFSNPGTAEQAARVRQDPRFWHQYYRRNAQLALPVVQPANDDGLSNDEPLTGRENGSLSDWFGLRRHHRQSPRNALKRDWSVSLGPNATVGAGNFPAKFSFDINSANCGSAPQPDFVVFNTSGSFTQASVVAFDNLYTGCGGNVPTTYWAYNTGGSVVTSVVLSLDGSQIAFVQNAGAAAPVASLVLLKWKATTDGATSTTPDPITTVIPSLYPTCTAPCMTTLTFSGTPPDTNSSPFYDYSNDALYVGDNYGSLHKFQPVFTTGVPAEVGSPLWPVKLASGFKLSSPVYDSGTRRVFVGSGSDGVFGGQLFAVDATTGNVFQTSPQLAKGNGIVSGPIVDSTAGLVYVFVGTDTGSITCDYGNGPPCSGVYQLSTNFISGGGTETPVSVGTAAGGFPVYPGAFDNSYYTSTNATGSLYVCGQQFGLAHLFKLSIVSGSMFPVPITDGLFVGGPAGQPSVPCSAVTEIFNPNLNSGVETGGPQGTDRIFFSVQGTANFNPCERGSPGGCLWALPATSWQPNTAYTVGQVILDDGQGMCVQVVTSAGTSDPLREPNWGANAGVSTADGSVTWAGKMCLKPVISPQPWIANATFGAGFSVLDSNGNIEAATVTGQTGSKQPLWPANIGARTVDGGQVWVNVGPIDVSSLTVVGGTSGIIVDNTVPTGTLPGASQIYFSPLGMGFGTCGAGNGCAVQASQSGLN